MHRSYSYFVSDRIIRRRHNRCLIKFAAALLFVMTVGFGTGSLISYANAKTSDAAPAGVSYKYYTSIRIEEGSTLYTIAEKYLSKEYKDTESYVSEVIQINALNDDETIHAGQFLIIPYYSEDIK